MDNGLVVGLGGSAGGIGAMQRFFERMPADSGAAFVAILHLSPEHESQLAHVLQASTTMPVTQVTHRTRVEPNRVYVIPPSRSLAMADGHLTLSEVTRIEERRAPIDVFFRTLAATHHSRAVGVVLSGTGADGSMGLKHIKENGGLCVAQDPEEAEFPDMPRSSITAGVVDHVLSTAAMAERILAYARHVLPTGDADESTEPASLNEDALRELLTELRLRTGHDFVNYKRPTVLRRIGRRLAVHEVNDLESYLTLVRERPDELHTLLKDLLISVTHFFRDGSAFQALEARVVPQLFERKGPDDQVRVWVAGCATGEEAYSIAMLLAEHAQSLPLPPAIQIFATDIDAGSIAAARQGLYSLNDAADVPAERLHRFFAKEGGGYRVRPELRETILFSQHNVIKDPPFSHLDLVSCRNLLIYLNRAAQRRVLEVMHFALGPGRYLFLGSAESAEASKDLFEPFDKDACLFQSRERVAWAGVPVPRSSGFARFDTIAPRVRDARASVPDKRLSADVHQRLLEEYAPPSVVLTPEYDVLHLSATAGRYMEVRGGDPSQNLIKLVREELRLELRSALYQAAQQAAPVQTPAVSVRLADTTVAVSMVVRPVPSPSGGSAAFLVLFLTADDTVPAAPPTALMAADDAAAHLHEEVARLKAQLRATLEHQDVQEEEHKAAVEEQQAMYEELRSSSEELETSREELQSLNEELRTVNQELRIKVDEQTRVNDDMQNLVNATEVGTIFLDRSLRLKFYTPSVRGLFNLIPGDLGRPLSDINTVLAAGAGDLQRDVERVINSLDRIEREIPTQHGRWLLMRGYPYRTADDRLDGVVLTFVDITERRNAAEATRESEERLRRAVDVENVAVTFFTSDGRITHANDAFLRISGCTRDQLDEGLLRHQTLTPPEGAAALTSALEELRTRGKTTPYERPYVHPNGTMKWTLSAATRLTAGEGVEFAVDITQSKRTEELLQQSETRLRLMIESVTEYAILTLDPLGRVDHWNEGAARMFGYEEAEIVGQSAALLFTPEDRAAGADREEMRQARDLGRAADERWHLRKTGERFFMSGVTAPLRNPVGTITGYIKVARDLTDRKRGEEALQSAHDALEGRVRERVADLQAATQTLRAQTEEHQRAEQQIRDLLGRIITVQEDERRRIARDLHDQVGQQVVALKLTVEAMEHAAGGPSALGAKIATAKSLIARLDADIDVFTSELRSPTLDELGLVAAMELLINEWTEAAGVDAQFHPDGFAARRLAQTIETCLYRITQEALNNVAKHAGATVVSVVLEWRQDRVTLVITDDGRGFEATKENGDAWRAIGLRGMRERATAVGGTLEIESAPGDGTTMRVQVPALAG
jgi:two-component system CheB/CheR fusion protein